MLKDLVKLFKMISFTQTYAGLGMDAYEES